MPVFALRSPEKAVRLPQEEQAAGTRHAVVSGTGVELEGSEGQNTVAVKLWVFMVLFHTRSGSKKLGKNQEAEKRKRNIMVGK